MQLSSVQSVQDFFNGQANVAVTRYEWLKHFNIDLTKFQNSLGMWFDEAQKLKNVNTVTHKQVQQLRQYCSAFHLVTATPIMSSLDDLWGLFKLLDSSILGTMEEFTNQYYVRQLMPHPRVQKRKKVCPFCGARLIYAHGWDYCTNARCLSIKTPSGYIPYRAKIKSIWEVVEYKNIKQLAKTIAPYMFCFFPKQDINYIIHKFEMNAATMQQYEAIAKDIDNVNSITPFSTRLIELQYLVDRSFEKKAELWKLANKIKHKGFVLYLSLYNTMGLSDNCTTLEQVKAVLDKVEGLQYRTYTGADLDEDKDKNKAWFQEDPKNKCLIISKAGGASLNLQVTNEFIFYNLPDGFGAMSQALGRVVRLFSSFSSFNIHILQADKSVDTYKYVAFLMYADLVQKLMNNDLANIVEPIPFNNHIKASMRKDWCWKQ